MAGVEVGEVVRTEVVASDLSVAAVTGLAILGGLMAISYILYMVGRDLTQE